MLNQSRLDDEHRLRAHGLFREGEDFGYGVLLRSSFHIKDAVAANNNRSLLAALGPAASSSSAAAAQQQPVFSIGLHLRHSSMEDVGGAEHGEWRCVREILARHFRPRLGSQPALRCVLYLATDRPRIMELWLNRSMHEFNCTTVHYTYIHTVHTYINQFITIHVHMYVCMTLSVCMYVCCWFPLVGDEQPHLLALLQPAGARALHGRDRSARHWCAPLLPCHVCM